MLGLASTLAVGHGTGIHLESDGIGRELPAGANIPFTAVAWAPGSGLLYAGRPDGTIIALYDGKPAAPQASKNVRDPIVQLLAVDERHLIGVLRDYTAFSLDWSEEGPRDLFDVRTETTCLARSSDSGLIACGCRDGSIRLRGSSTPAGNARQGLETEISSISFSCDGRFVAAAPVLGQPVIWKIDNWLPAITLDSHISTRGTGMVCFHPALRLLAVADGKVITIFEFQALAGAEPATSAAPSPSAPSSPSTDDTYFAGSATSDQAASRDTLGFAPYVSALSRFLLNEQTTAPLTVSIEGEWGSGKSSFMLQLQHALEDEKKLVVRFNPWRHDREDSLWAAFVLEFVRQIARQRSVWKTLRCRLDLLRRRWDWRTGWLEATKIVLLLGLVASSAYAAWSGISHLSDFASTGVPGAAMLLLVWGAWKIWQRMPSGLRKFLRIDVKKALQSPDYGQRVAFVERLHEDFRKVVEAYAGDEKVFVFIDDLDRCEIPKAADLMQALNLLMLDEPQLVFILGMDREKVAAGLAAKHEKLLRYLNHHSGDVSAADGLSYGYEFIEKFIQIPFQVPRPAAAGVKAMLTSICSDQSQGTKDAARWWHRWPWRGAHNKTSGVALGDAVPLPSAGADTLGEPERQERDSSSVKAERTVWQLGPEDAPAVREVAAAVAPYLGNNPRRVKQFINLLRLRACLAVETGLIPDLGGSCDTSRAALCRLGKFIAIGLQAPRLLADLQRESVLLKNLQKVAVGQPVDDAEQSGLLAQWAADQELLALLRHGCCETDSDESDSWRLEYSAVTRLLEVSPPVQDITVNRVGDNAVPPPAAGSFRGAAPGALTESVAAAIATSPSERLTSVPSSRYATGQEVAGASTRKPKERRSTKRVDNTARGGPVPDEIAAMERLGEMVEEAGGRLSIGPRTTDALVDAEIEFIDGDRVGPVLGVELKLVTNRADLPSVGSPKWEDWTSNRRLRSRQSMLLVACDMDQRLYGMLVRSNASQDWRELSAKILHQMRDEAEGRPLTISLL